MSQRFSAVSGLCACLCLAASPTRAAPAPARETARPATARPAPRPEPRPVVMRAVLPPPKPAAAPKRQQGWFHWSYFIDWGLVAGLAGGVAALRFSKLPNTRRDFDVDDPDISKPYHQDTVPTWQLSFFALAPAVTIGLAQIHPSRSAHDVHHAFLGLSEALAMTLFTTLVIKKSVGALRPDFLDRCEPDAAGQCTGSDKVVEAGRDSFPSGHASTAFAGATFMSLYLWGKLRPFRTGGALWKMLLVLAPLVPASLVAASRVSDNRHRPIDVLAGSFIGMGFAYLAYRLHYPNPWAKDGGRPRTRRTLMATPMVGGGNYGIALTGVLD